MSNRRSKQNKTERLARSSIPKAKDHIAGWPREHYNADRTPKMQYKTEQSARGVAAMMMRKTGTSQLEVYRCTYCGCWHIGHAKLLPIEERQLTMKQTIQGELTILKHYRDELNHVAAEILALQTKIENLEHIVQDHYRELILLTVKNQQQ